ncbi:MAG: bifunctional (p)ppGpp synthetase/guanosine-3',5'-bis(diphosphate) 3'-pyrophosphohydrolase [Acidobacteria bacterium]|nr:bifunctional (p)ppGpp synthetase/guanosine-3',5'-bis(diphosphate) 3'-pyrophosphohydrolase [Acidobacteriota bacterium]
MRVSKSTARAADSLTATRFAELAEKVQQYRPRDDLERLRRAFEFSAREHASQTRASGEAFLSHPLAVAHLLAEMRLDITALCAALLHDIVEDTRVSLDTIGAEFGPDVARLVAGVTKLSRLDFSSQEAHQAESLRKMLLAMTDDIRVVLVKLADRLHNMRTLAFLPPDKRLWVARETLEIYAPIAHRLGMGRIRGELEDLAFRVLEPDRYLQLQQQLEGQRRLNESFLTSVRSQLAAELAKNNIAGRVEGRIKRLYSVHQKLLRQSLTFDQLYDLLALRVITDTVRNCYAALGIVHQLWRPVPGRFKDYIAMPSPNLYQSLHTTVVSEGQHFELQIRTEEMHRVSEQGIAAHWKYKDAEDTTATDAQRVAWLRHLIEWAKEVEDPSEFLSTLKLDLYPEEVYTFTPKGKVVVLPRGATPVDFAYAIHTEVGHSCTGAKVNGRIVPLRYRLQNGEVVEILTQSGHTPSRDWLSFVGTSRARNKIRHWINLRQRQQAIDLGRRLLEREARRAGLSLKKIPEESWLRTARDYGCPNVDQLHVRIGFGQFAPRQILAKLVPASVAEPRPRREPLRALRRTVRRVFRLREERVAFGGQELLIYRARCCNPIRDEPIIGYITRGRGIAVHAKTCPNVENLLYEAERRIEVEWAPEAEESYLVRLVIQASDRPGLLKEMTTVLADHKSNIRNAEARSEPGLAATIELTFDVTGMEQLERIVAGLKKVRGVANVSRLPRL